jgi:hypothetical protein
MTYLGCLSKTPYTLIKKALTQMYQGFFIDNKYSLEIITQTK